MRLNWRKSQGAGRTATRAGLVIGTADHAGVPVLTLSGDADSGTLWALREALPWARAAAREARVPLALDFRDVGFIDSTAVALFSEENQRENRETGGGLVVLIRPDSHPLRVVRVTQADRLCRVLVLEASAVGEAVAAAIRSTVDAAPGEPDHRD